MKDLSKGLQSRKVVIGAKSLMRELKNGNLTKVYLSKNCSPLTEQDFRRYCKLSDVKIVETQKTPSELGILCKKQYNIQAIGLKK